MAEIEPPLPEPLQVGEPAPRFHVAGANGQPIAFDSLAGRYIVLGLIGRAEGEAAAALVAQAAQSARRFDPENVLTFWVSCDPADEREGRLRQAPFNVFWDFDLAISTAFRAARSHDGAHTYRPSWIVLDPRLRVILSAPIAEAARVMDVVAALPSAAAYDGDLPAPVLIVPRVFEPELCAKLIAAYGAGQPIEGGFMRQVEGKTVRVVDPVFKRRADVLLEEGALRDLVRARLAERLVPEVARGFQFQATRIERYLVARYDAEEGGFFKPHRDNTTTGTAHRKFAVTINLNAEDYDGGDLNFPEFGARAYRAPTGGAVVFSCSLMHQALPVTRGARYAFLPFLYDEAGAAVREANLSTVAVP